jgi:hypothetical protein
MSGAIDFIGDGLATRADGACPQRGGRVHLKPMPSGVSGQG